MGQAVLGLNLQNNLSPTSGGLQEGFIETSRVHFKGHFEFPIGILFVSYEYDLMISISQGLSLQTASLVGDQFYENRNHLLLKTLNIDQTLKTVLYNDTGADDIYRRYSGM